MVFATIGLATVLGAVLAGPAYAGEGNQDVIVPVSGGVGEDGACAQVTGTGITQTWEFNVDDIFGDTSTARLFASFSDGTSVVSMPPTTPDDEGNQATWLVETAAGATLDNAAVDVTNANSDGADLVVVSCTLSGVATTTTAAPTTTTTVTVAPAVVTTTTAAPPVTAAAELPRTGSSSGPLAAAAMVLLAVGIAAVLTARRAPRTR